MLDVRAPVEYARGAIPNSTNIPILEDDERRRVGTAYKHSGKAAAVALGHKLVSGETKTKRIQAWLRFVAEHPGARVMCWRGGLRSKLAQTWLAELNCEVEQLDGGYRTLRRACIETLEQVSSDPKRWWVVAGRTGVQKTVLIHKLETSIDLEHIAHHRGSAFGAYPTGQPYPATFENELACAYLRHRCNMLVLEDESRTIGRLALPAAWHARMQAAPLVLLEADMDTRVQHIVSEYVTNALAGGETSMGLQLRYRDSLQRISRRLGGLLHRNVVQELDDAFANKGPHEAWVHTLLSAYYDPMYDYQLRSKQARIRFRGDMTAVQEYLTDKAAQ